MFEITAELFELLLTREDFRVLVIGSFLMSTTIAYTFFRLCAPSESHSKKDEYENATVSLLSTKHTAGVLANQLEKLKTNLDNLKTSVNQHTLTLGLHAAEHESLRKIARTLSERLNTLEESLESGSP